MRTNIKDIYGEDAAAPSESTPIKCGKCGRPTVKPTTVLFGASLPERFFSQSQDDLPAADLLIIAGTSLVVSPANSLAYRVPDRNASASPRCRFDHQLYPLCTLI